MKYTFARIAMFVVAAGSVSVLLNFWAARPVIAQAPVAIGNRADPCLDETPGGNAFGREEHLCSPQGTSAGIAKGDFNGDGLADLAIGNPQDIINGIASGSVNVVYGARSGTGLDASSTADPKPQLFYGGEIFYIGTDVFAIPGGAVAGNQFGAALAAGNFNGDQYTDLAIGVPGWNGNTGAVVVLYGGPNGLSAANHNELIYEGGIASFYYSNNSLNLVPNPITGGQSGDRFGSSLAWGHFGNPANPQYADLVIGIPGKWVVNSAGAILQNAGAVLVMNGGAFGLAGGAFAPFGTGPTTQYFDLSVPGIASNGGPGNPRNIGPVAFDRFGSALTGGDFNHDGFTDLAIGIPFRDVTRSDGTFAQKAGAVTVLHGGTATAYYTFCFLGCGPNPLTVIGVSGSQLWTQAHMAGHLIGASTTDTSDTNEHFGSALASGDFDGNTFDDLAIGVPQETINGQATAGAVNVISGSSSGLSLSGHFSPEFITLGDTGVNPSVAGDWFGFSLASADFNGDGFKDLAIGSPNKTLRDYVNEFPCLCSVDHLRAGAVTVLYGNPGPGVLAYHFASLGGFQAVPPPYTPPQFLFQGGNTARAEPRYQYTDNKFGYSLTAWKFDSDPYADLAIGVPEDSLQPRGDVPFCGCALGSSPPPSVSAAGAVQVLYGGSSGFSLSSSRNQKFHQTVSFTTGGFNLPGLAQPGDAFGRAVY